MIALAYLFPVIAIVILKTVLHLDSEWTVFLWIFIAGEGTVGLLHIGIVLFQTLKTEYLGSIVKSIHFEDSWTELIENKKYKKNSKGEFYPVKTVREKYHYPKYYFYTTRNSKIKTDSSFYKYVLNQWQKTPQYLSWADNHIKGGTRYGESCSADYNGIFETCDNSKWVSVTEQHLYLNRITQSYSIFRHKDISKKEAYKLGLYFYPNKYFHDIPCILYDHCKNYLPDYEITKKFQRFNGVFAPRNQMRLFILLFESGKGLDIAVAQKNFWQGGNKNEFVICLGISSKRKVEWSFVFSWADEQEIEIETQQWFLKNKNLDLNKFYDWFLQKYNRWKRKEFKDFKYIRIPLDIWQIMVIYVLSIFENIMAIKIALEN